MNLISKKLKMAALAGLLFSVEKTIAQDPHAKLPAAPSWGESSMDGRGKIRLAWQQTEEKDVLGYWVGFANSKKDEFSLLHGRRLEQPFFDWKLKEKSLNDAAHFVVVTEDRRHNRSKPSQVLTLKRPDKSAPLPPFLLGVSQKGDELGVAWKTSASQDAEKQVIFRRNLSVQRPEWEPIDTLDGQIEQFTDDKTLLENWYEYRLAAIDDAGNLSKFSNAAKGQRRFRADAAKVKTLAVEQPDDGEGLRVIVKWQFDVPKKGSAPETPNSFTIYRAEGNGRLAVIAQTKESTWTDVKIDRGALYSYAVRAHFDESHLGELSASKSIVVK